MWKMVLIFDSPGSAGYALEHFRRAICLQPLFFAAVTASSISATVAIPVEMITGLPVDAIRSISGMSTISNEAIL